MKKKLIISNTLMLVIPIVLTFVLVLASVLFIISSVLNGKNKGFSETEDFYIITSKKAEIMQENLHKAETKEQKIAYLKSNKDFFDKYRARVITFVNGEEIYRYGHNSPQDKNLMQAVKTLNSDTALTSTDERYLLYSRKADDNENIELYIFSFEDILSFEDAYKTITITVIFIIVFALITILLTNRFLTKFIWSQIDDVLTLLQKGIEQVKKGNLKYRINYQKDDEFKPYFDTFDIAIDHLETNTMVVKYQERSSKELLAAISHDLRSPLTSILAYVDGLIEGIANSPELENKYLQTIKKKALNMQDLTNQLFEFSKFDLNGIPTKFEKIRLDKLIYEIINNNYTKEDLKGLSIKLNLNEAVVFGDKKLFQRIVANIIENCIKYNDNENPELEISVHKRQKDCLLRFSDNGSGIDDEIINNIFEPFVKGDKARKSENLGSGLGLSIVARAVSLMGGKIKAKNKISGGLIIDISVSEVGG
ncbi:MAG: HAMP domain-containing sensor histidine kinase [Clostridia bacterium]|nr:HAMP domain-containing sensor histidine kinase [Clostridia bacterium]